MKHSEGIGRLADAIRAVAKHIDDRVRTGAEPAQVDERAALMIALAQELRKEMGAATAAQGAVTPAPITDTGLTPRSMSRATKPPEARLPSCRMLR